MWRRGRLCERRNSELQGLHSDLGLGRVPHDQQRSLPAAKIAVNFAVEDVFFDNGPMRVVPRRKVLTNREQPLAFLDEPSAHELGTVALQPLKAGAAVIRDLRLWHSGAPNFGKSTRFLPNVEVCSLEYATHIDDPRHTFTQTECTACCRPKCALPRKERAKSIPPAVFAQLSPRCRPYCERIVVQDGAAIPLPRPN